MFSMCYTCERYLTVEDGVGVHKHNMLIKEGSLGKSWATEGRVYQETCIPGQFTAVTQELGVNKLSSPGMAT